MKANMNSPPSQCVHYTGSVRCPKRAVFTMNAPDGKAVPGYRVCEEHGHVVHDEYLAKLDEDWPLIAI